MYNGYTTLYNIRISKDVFSKHTKVFWQAVKQYTKNDAPVSVRAKRILLIQTVAVWQHCYKSFELAKFLAIHSADVITLAQKKLPYPCSR